MNVILRRVALLVCFTFFLSESTVAQTDLDHSVYLELGGSAGIYSLNYDLIFLKKNDFKIGARTGLQLLKEGYEGTTMDFYVPVTMNFMYALAKKHHVELGLGAQIASYEIRNIISETEIGFVRKTEALGNATLGYRYQNPDGGFMFRVFYSPFLYQDGVYTRYEHWAGVSLGFTFLKKKEKN